MSEIKIAVIQMSNINNDKQTTLERAAHYIDQAADRGAQIIGLGELFQTEYFCSVNDDANFKLAEPIPGPTTDFLAVKAKERAVAIIGSMFEQDGNQYYNAAFVIDQNGEVAGKYRKNHIPDIHYGSVQTEESYYFSPGNLGFPVFDVFDCKIGILICYDRSFPEAWRELKFNGAEIVFVPTASSGWRGELWKTELIVRAMESNIFVAAPNRGGYQGELSFFGQSIIINPLGKVLTEAGKDEECVLVEAIDLAEIKTAEEKMPFLKHRRPELYQRTCASN